MADTELLRLARRHHVATGYRDWRGRVTEVGPDTIRSVLGALDVDTSSRTAVAAELAKSGVQWSTRLLPPVLVHHPAAAAVANRPGAVPAPPQEQQLWLPVADKVWVELADGGAVSLRPGPRITRHHGELGRTRVEAGLRLPAEVPGGWHRLHAERGDRHESAALLVVRGGPQVPRQRSWGLMTQLYSLRSRRSWGMGDLRDLADLVTWSASAFGAGFVLVNPLHAGEPVPPVSPSPYRPMSRRFTSPLYLRVEQVPEYHTAAPQDRRRIAESARPLRERNRTLQPLDRDAVWEAKRRALELLYRIPRTPAREGAFAAFRTREGGALTAFATWCALAEGHGADWEHWPAELRDPRSPAVAAARERLAERVGFHCWLQWQLDEQLAAAQQAAQAAGMPVGVVHDLAVGVHPGGADTWAYPSMFASGMSVGAPPDEFNQRGQDWGQPPWHPRRLADAEYRPYRELLDHALRHAGGLRLDHAMQVSRLWWIPRGASADQGTYVGYDQATLLGIICAQAAQAGALLVGEDLGVVPSGFREELAGRSVLGTSLLWFERDRHGAPLPPRRWRRLCLATVGTHDMPTIGGFVRGDHIALRDRLGLLTRPVGEELADHEHQLAGWLHLLTELGLLGDDRSPEAITAALHAFLARTPARLVGISLADAVGEWRTQNQPGTTDEYPNWRVPLADAEGRCVLLEELGDDARVRAVLAPVGGLGTA